MATEKKTFLSKIEVEISNIEVDERYYTFNYRVTLNGKLKDKGEINDDYENGDTPKQWKKTLEQGEAVNLAIIRAFE